MLPRCVKLCYELRLLLSPNSQACLPPRADPPPRPPQDKKCTKKPEELTELERKIARYMLELETSTTSSQLKDLKGLKFASAKEFETADGKKAIIVFVPPPSLPEFRKIQKVLVEELEKKLTGCTVLLIANRTMVQPKVWAHSKSYSGVRPRSRTLKAVQEAMLDDIVFPSEIVGKRTTIRTDQSRTLKCLLSTREQGATEGKIDTFQAIYKKITGKVVELRFTA